MRHDARSLFDPRWSAVNARPDDNRISGLLLNDTPIYHHLTSLNRRYSVLYLRAQCVERPSRISRVLSKARQVDDVFIPDIRPSQNLRPVSHRDHKYQEKRYYVSHQWDKWRE
jgi:hypothetical protein